ncbi:MAG: hypothetical protein GMKNLPBB_00485 [Myxococcota bacterium]|nr:hypothetical protein [Myxococcota bacterium]
MSEPLISPPGVRPFKRIAVINRGEPASRFIRAVRELNLTRGDPLVTVAFFTLPDEDAPFVRMADESVSLGEAITPMPDGSSKHAYLDHERLIRLIHRRHCDAVWPGWGFISEDAAFVELLEQEGVCFIGPSSAAMRRLGEKLAAKQLAREIGVPVLEWREVTEGAVLTEGLRFPVIIKAASGGGGRGIRLAESPAELAGAIAATRAETEKSFGSSRVYLEEYLPAARHVEAQIVADAHGNVWCAGLRECSIQRRRQKVIEEAPPAGMDPGILQAIEADAIRMAAAAGYRNVGTFEFLADASSGRRFFIEANTRLQVEHTVTEEITGLDLVKTQIAIAMGAVVEKPPAPVRGHAIQARVCAEDPAQGFAPAPGRVTLFAPASGPGVRVDTGVVQGMDIPPEFDSMIAKVIARGADRSEARARLIQALRESHIVIEGGHVNKSFLLELLESEDFGRNHIHTQWIDGRSWSANPPSSLLAKAFAAAALIEFRRLRKIERERFFRECQNGIPLDLPRPGGVRVELSWQGAPVRLRVYGQGRYRFWVELAGDFVLAEFEPRGGHSARMRMQGETFAVLFSGNASYLHVEINGYGVTIRKPHGGVIAAPTPAIVMSIQANEGDIVEQGGRLLSLEAMKMEMPVSAPSRAIVKAIHVRKNQQVAKGQPLLSLEPVSGGSSAAAPPVGLTFAGERPLEAFFHGEKPAPEMLDFATASDAQRSMNELTSSASAIMLGFDLMPLVADRLASLLSEETPFSALRHPERWTPLIRALEAWAAVESALERNPPRQGDDQPGVSAETRFYEFCRERENAGRNLPADYEPWLREALSHYEIEGMHALEDIERALWRMAVARRWPEARSRLCAAILRILVDLHAAGSPLEKEPGLHGLLNRIARLAQGDHPHVADLALQASYVIFDSPRFVQRRKQEYGWLRDRMALLSASPRESERAREVWLELVRAPYSLSSFLVEWIDPNHPWAESAARVMLQRFYANRHLTLSSSGGADRAVILHAFTGEGEEREAITAVFCAPGDLKESLRAALRQGVVKGMRRLLDVVCSSPPGEQTQDGGWEKWWKSSGAVEAGIDRITLSWPGKGSFLQHRTFDFDGDGFREKQILRNIHSDVEQRLEFSRLGEFELTRLDSHEMIYAFHGKALRNPRDERIFVIAEVRDVPFQRETGAEGSHLLDFEHAYLEALKVLRKVQSKRGAKNRLLWNHLIFHVRPVMRIEMRDVRMLARRLEGPSRGLGIESVEVRMRIGNGDGEPAPSEVVIRNTEGQKLDISIRPAGAGVMRSMSPYDIKVLECRRMRLAYPYEIIRMLTGSGGSSPGASHPDLEWGEFVEYDVDPANPDRLIPVGGREPGLNGAGVAVGLIRNRTRKFPEGMERVWIASDPTRNLGALAEPECRRILGAIDLAEERGLPIEWIPVSSGALISMDSGTENLDWTARVLRRIVEFTGAGGEINIIVSGVNVGAQTYWDAESTMLMHTRGVLIMTRRGSMVLTGKRALEYSGSVAAEDETGIGGHDRVMGPNGQAQYHASSLSEAYSILMEHYHFTCRRRDERAPRRWRTMDPPDRNPLDYPYSPVSGEEFTRVGDIFDEAKNPGRKKPFAIRQVMAALMDQDGGHLERFRALAGGETAVVWDAHIGGYPVCMIGFESRPLPRRDQPPLDGPDLWTGGTLYPNGSKKVARAINAASGNRPVVVLANLSGFDGSPESMRKLQLEYGAEIGRAVVRFQGKIVFLVVGRYHGGAYVVFSRQLNPGLTVIATEGSYASVIGGAPAAAVVFPREAQARALADERVSRLQKALEQGADRNLPRLREEYNQVFRQVLLEKQGEIAAGFDGIHTVHRALRVGSINAVIPPARMREAIIQALEGAGGFGPPGGDQSSV